MTACLACPRGTFGEKLGADKRSDCELCKAGFYQPAPQQANHTVCLKCEPGKYSPLAGVAACASCPAGTYSDIFQADKCNICPDGQWTFNDGARKITDCTPCSGSRQCRGGSSARITIEVLDVAVDRINGVVSTKLRAGLASDLSETLGVDSSIVLDLFGESASVTCVASRVAGRMSMKISAFVTVPADSTANALAAQIYTDAFRAKVGKTVKTVLSEEHEQLALLERVEVFTVALKPERFTPLQHTTTVLTTTQKITTSTTIKTTSSVPATTTAVETTETTRDAEPVHRDITTTQLPSVTGAAAGQHATFVVTAVSALIFAHFIG